MGEEIIVLVTASGLIQARRLADALVERRLVACVNLISGIESIYHWNGEIQHDSEVLLILKTTRARFAAVEAAVKELHTYEVPEVIALPIEQGSAAYLDWVRSCVAKRREAPPT